MSEAEAAWLDSIPLPAEPARVAPADPAAAAADHMATPSMTSMGTRGSVEGIFGAGRDLRNTAEVAAGRRTAEPEAEPADGYERIMRTPYSKLAPGELGPWVVGKVAEATTRSAPMVAGALLGALAGTAITGPGAPVGAVVGGAAGGAAAAAIQTFGTAYDNAYREHIAAIDARVQEGTLTAAAADAEKQRAPSEAFDKAFAESGVAAAFGAAGAGASVAVRNALKATLLRRFSADLGVQTALGVAQVPVTNLATGRETTSDQLIEGGVTGLGSGLALEAPHLGGDLLHRTTAAPEALRAAAAGMQAEAVRARRESEAATHAADPAQYGPAPPPEVREARSAMRSLVEGAARHVGIGPETLIRFADHLDGGAQGFFQPGMIDLAYDMAAHVPEERIAAIRAMEQAGTLTPLQAAEARRVAERTMGINVPFRVWHEFAHALMSNGSPLSGRQQAVLREAADAWLRRDFDPAKLRPGSRVPAADAAGLKTNADYINWLNGWGTHADPVRPSPVPHDGPVQEAVAHLAEMHLARGLMPRMGAALSLERGQQAFARVGAALRGRWHTPESVLNSVMHGNTGARAGRSALSKAASPYAGMGVGAMPSGIGRFDDERAPGAIEPGATEPGATEPGATPAGPRRAAQPLQTGDALADRIGGLGAAPASYAGSDAVFNDGLHNDTGTARYVPFGGKPPPLASFAEREAGARRGVPDTSGFDAVRPVPQRQLAPEDYTPGGRFMARGEDITGQTRSAGRIEAAREPGRAPGRMDVAPQQRETIGAKSGDIVRTNMFRRSAGWSWSQAPAGWENAPALVAVETGGKHVYALAADFEHGVEMARYPGRKAEPRLRPTARGDVELGKQVGEINVRGRMHPVYDRAFVFDRERLASSDRDNPDRDNVASSGNRSADDERMGHPRVGEERERGLAADGRVRQEAGRNGAEAGEVRGRPEPLRGEPGAVYAAGAADSSHFAPRLDEVGRTKKGDPVYSGQDAASRNLPALEGMPRNIRVEDDSGFNQVLRFGPNARIRQGAEDYARQAGIDYNPSRIFAPVDETRARRIADAYEAMANDPADPQVRAAYDQMARETLAQWSVIKRSGLQVEFNAGGVDPYLDNPRNAILDVVNNNHMFVFSTEEGYGQTGISDAERAVNPMLAVVPGETWSGQPVLVNDVFRVVHDYFGHAKEGVGFRADGEENAWRSHAAMYTPLARQAMTSETRGQNSWVNYGPQGEANRTAKVNDTGFADQKVGLLPDWVGSEGAEDFLRSSNQLASSRRDSPAVGAEDTISTRVPSHVGADPEQHKKNTLRVGYESSKEAKAAFINNAQIIESYPNYRPTKAANTWPKVVENFTNDVVGNLLWLFDHTTVAETRNRAKLWYDGARTIAEHYAEQYQVPVRAVAAVMAGLSPQKDWYQNVSLGERVMDIMTNRSNTPWSSKMTETAQRIFGGPQYADDLRSITGRRLRELNHVDSKAMWLRIYDETYGDPNYRVVTPEGGRAEYAMTGKGERKRRAWGSLVEISKAVSSFSDPSRENISRKMGEAHKVRNFYNNIVSPKHDANDVTIDTHAVAAALLRPLSGNAPEVAAGLGLGIASNHAGTGSKGLYGVYAEAYRRAGAARGVSAREMQSITWEAVRGLYSPVQKRNKAFLAKTAAIWDNYGRGNISITEAREQIHGLAGGIDYPTWHRPGAGHDEAEGDADHAPELPGVELAAGRAGTVDGGTRDRDADGSAGRGDEDPQGSEAPSGRGRVDRSEIWYSSSRDTDPEGRLITASLVAGAKPLSASSLIDVIESMTGRRVGTNPLPDNLGQVDYPDNAPGGTENALRAARVDVRDRRDARILSHELGHLGQLATFGHHMDPPRPEVARQLKAFSPMRLGSFLDRYPPSQHAAEMFAEAVSAYATWPAGFKEKAPAAARWVRDTLNNSAVRKWVQFNVLPAVLAASQLASSSRDNPTAYHASPHRFDRFDSDKIGSGSGAQVRGHGLYFDGSELLADSYRQWRAPRLEFTGGLDAMPMAERAGLEGALDMGFAAGARTKGDLLDLLRATNDPRLAAVEKHLDQLEPSRGFMYEASLGIHPDNTLDYDVPYRQQPGVVQRAIRSALPTGRALAVRIGNLGGSHLTPADAAAAAVFRDTGVPGITYANPSLRQTGIGSRGYVMLDDRKINLLRRYSSSGRDQLPATLPGFYSAVERAVQAKLPARGPANAMLASITNATGVKVEEMKWLGLSTWLGDQGNRVVTKEAIADYIAANNLGIKEVWKGGDRVTFANVDEAKEFAARHNEMTVAELEKEYGYRNPKNYIDLANHIWAAETVSMKPRHGEHTLPGGEDYHELLITLPERPNTKQYAEVRQLPSGRFDVEGFGGTRQVFDTRAEADAEVARINRNVGRARPEDDKDNFVVAGHWTEPNVVGHVRFKDRTIGNKHVLFLEEVQSDWHQRGRENGYRAANGEPPKNPGNFATFAAREGMTAPEAMKLFESAGREENPVYQRWDAAHTEYLDALRVQDKGVPDAPFKTTWPALLMKRMLSYAAQNGYQAVAWTKGDTQADRWGQRQTYTRLFYDPNAGRLMGYHGTTVLLSEKVPLAELPKRVGREVAQELLGTQVNERGMHILERPDLKVGGHGMREFYDRQLPNQVNDLVKRSGARVERATLEHPGELSTANMRGFYDIEERYSGWRIIDQTQGAGEMLPGSFATEAEANTYLDEHLAMQGGGKATEVHLLNIPDTMRQAIDQDGFPLFSMRRDALDAVKHLREATDEMVTSFVPMRGGSATSRVWAAKFASALRGVQYRYGEIDRLLTRNFTPAQRERMGKALDEQSLFEQILRDYIEQIAGTDPHDVVTRREQARFEAAGLGLASLTPEERAVVGQLNHLAREAWTRLEQRGMVKPGAEGIPMWMPRVFVGLDANGRAARVQGPPKKGSSSAGAGLTAMDPVGRNLSTNATNWRQILRTEDSLAHMQKRFGANTELVSDIRVMAHALAKEEKAIAGRDLVDAIKRMGQQMGKPTVTSGPVPASTEREWFTLDHPSLVQFRPLMQRRPDGSMKTVLDEHGQVVMAREPMRIAREFEGPLKAVLTGPSPTWVQALMKLKGGVMHMIMWSPFIHLAVEAGRALPIMPGKVITGRVFLRGNRMQGNRVEMDEALGAGLAPIGRGWSVDPNTIADESASSTVTPGRITRAAIKTRDLLAKAVASPAHLIGAKGLARGVEAVVKHPHQTLLWDRIFDLQMGIYGEMRDRYLAKGFTRGASTIMAAHLANRYAGALPPETMHRYVNTAANLTMFSRSFTLGNLAVMKDALTGAPAYVLDQVAAAGGVGERDKAKKALRGKAMSAMVLDIGLYFLATAALQSGLRVLLADDKEKAKDSEAEGYLRRLHHEGQNLMEHPWAILYPPGVAQSLSPLNDNEPGKHERIYLGRDETGRGIYGRVAAGKVGEEFVGWMQNPRQMVVNKMSTLLRPLVEIALNTDSLGRQILRPDAETGGELLDNAGRAVWHFMKSQLPVDAVTGAWHLANGDATGDPGVNRAKLLGPMTGMMQISQGYPGGPEEGVRAAALRRAQLDRAEAMPEARRLVELGREDEARALLERADIPAREVGSLMRGLTNPNRAAITRRRLFNRRANDEERERLEHVTGGEGYAEGGEVEHDYPRNHHLERQGERARAAHRPAPWPDLEPIARVLGASRDPAEVAAGLAGRAGSALGGPAGVAAALLGDLAFRSRPAYEGGGQVGGRYAPELGIEDMRQDVAVGGVDGGYAVSRQTGALGGGGSLRGSLDYDDARVGASISGHGVRVRGGGAHRTEVRPDSASVYYSPDENRAISAEAFSRASPDGAASHGKAPRETGGMLRYQLRFADGGDAQPSFERPVEAPPAQPAQEPAPTPAGIAAAVPQGQQWSIPLQERAAISERLRNALAPYLPGKGEQGDKTPSRPAAAASSTMSPMEAGARAWHGLQQHAEEPGIAGAAAALGPQTDQQLRAISTDPAAQGAYQALSMWHAANRAPGLRRAGEDQRLLSGIAAA
jgi:hypothetical protein